MHASHFLLDLLDEKQGDQQRTSDTPGARWVSAQKFVPIQSDRGQTRRTRLETSLI